MSKKKIIIVSHNLRIGGVERSLLGLLNSLDYSRVEVDLFLFYHDGEFMPMIPEEVNILPQIDKYSTLMRPAAEVLKMGYPDVLFHKWRAKRKARKFCTANNVGPDNLVMSTYLQREVAKCLPKITDKVYDLAVSFLTPHYIVPQKLKARKTIAWIHTDYSFFEVDSKVETAMWDQYDYIAAISDESGNAFLKTFPGLKSKMTVIENILSPAFVRGQAQEHVADPIFTWNSDEVAICSVGRFTDAKNFHNVPEIVRLLKESGCKVRWFLIGYGGDEQLVLNRIEENNVSHEVVILGKKENPYPYMQACDIYAQPSRYEGKAVAVREAQILGKPVIITDFPTSKSQLTDGVDGIIVGLDNQACAEGIRQLIQDRTLRERLTEHCLNSDYGNEQEVDKIIKLL